MENNVDYLSQAFKAITKYNEQLESDDYQADDSDLDILDLVITLSKKATKQVQSELNVE